MSLQAVVLCTPQALWPLTDKRPSCLLPVCNRPLLWYQLTLLHRTPVEFRSIFLVVAKEDVGAIQSFLSDDCDPSLVTTCLLHVVDGLDGDYDAAVLRDLWVLGANSGALRPSSAVFEADFRGASQDVLGPKLDGPFVLLAAPVLLEDCLGELVDSFRSEDADLALLLRRKSDEKGGKSKSAAKEAPPDEVHCFHESGSGGSSRCVFMHSLEDAEVASEALDARQVVLPKALLKQRRRVQLKRNYWDVGVYVMAGWIPRFLATDEGEPLTSIRREVVPYVVNHQFRGADPFGGAEILAAGRAPSVAASMEYSTRQLGLPTMLLSATRSANVLPPLALEEGTKPSNCDSPMRAVPLLEAESRDSVRCFALRLDSRDQLCLRMDSVESFKEMNRAVLTLRPHPKIPWDSPVPQGTLVRSREHSAVGASTSMPPRVAIKNSILGNDCVIEERVKLNAVILMDGVRVQEGASLQNSIVSTGAVVEKGARITDCLVGPDAVVEEETEAREDVFSAESFAS